MKKSTLLALMPMLAVAVGGCLIFFSWQLGRMQCEKSLVESMIDKGLIFFDGSGFQKVEVSADACDFVLFLVVEKVRPREAVINMANIGSGGLDCIVRSSISSVELVGPSKMVDEDLWGVSQVERLALVNLKLTDRSLDIIAEFPKLRTLILQDVYGISDDGIASLGKSNSLRELEVVFLSYENNSNTIDSGLRRLQELRPDIAIDNAIIYGVVPPTPPVSMPDQ